MQIFRLKHFSCLFQKEILASISLRQIYNCSSMSLYIFKEEGISFVKFHYGPARGSGVRGPALQFRVMVLIECPGSYFSSMPNLSYSHQCSYSVLPVFSGITI